MLRTLYTTTKETSASQLLHICTFFVHKQVEIVFFTSKTHSVGAQFVCSTYEDDLQTVVHVYMCHKKTSLQKACYYSHV